MDRSGPADAGADQAARLIATRRSWHGVAELVMAGPQYRRSGSIKLRVLPGGFGTVAEPDLRVDAAELVAGDRRHLLNEVTYGVSLGDAEIAGPWSRAGRLPGPSA